MSWMITPQYVSKIPSLTTIVYRHIENKEKIPDVIQNTILSENAERIKKNGDEVGFIVKIL